MQQNMVWHILDRCLRWIAFLHIGTLQDCHPTLTKVLGNASQYMNFWQCESRNMQTRHSRTNIQNVAEGVMLHHHCEICV